MKRKKLPKKQKARKLTGTTLFAFLSLSLLIIFLFSTATAKIGDHLFAKDKISQAETAYTIAKVLNPFDKTLDQRLLGIQITKTERREESEETADKAELAYGNFTNTHVLGASATVPVLMYHYIRVNPDPRDKVGFGLSVTPSNFSAQMDYLVSHGYHSITLDELGNVLVHTGTLPQKPIVITFDDSYADSYTAAYPILKSHGLKGVNFVITGLVDAPNYLTWGQITEMKNSGIFTFGAHTVHHYALPYLSAEAVKQEVTQSKNDLQAHLGYVINWLAYPYGSVNPSVASITQQAGYVGAFGTNFGSYLSPNAMFTLPRVRVGGGDTVATFAAKLPWR